MPIHLLGVHGQSLSLMDVSTPEEGQWWPKARQKPPISSLSYCKTSCRILLILFPFRVSTATGGLYNWMYIIRDGVLCRWMEGLLVTSGGDLTTQILVFILPVQAVWLVVAHIHSWDTQACFAAELLQTAFPNVRILCKDQKHHTVMGHLGNVKSGCHIIVNSLTLEGINVCFLRQSHVCGN